MFTMGSSALDLVYIAIHVDLVGGADLNSSRRCFWEASWAGLLATLAEGPSLCAIARRGLIVFGAARHVVRFSFL